MKLPARIDRRQALKASAAVATVAALNPRMAFASSATADQFRVAAVGIGGRGKADLDGMKSHPKFKLTAIADVDSRFHGNADEFGADVKKFQDYRELFDAQSDSFDGILIATPDHMHAPIALTALEHGKHVYLQKPLCQDVGECRVLAEVAAQKPDLATQMGIQIHAHPAYRTAVSWLQSGLIGKVKEVHSWSGKGWGGDFPEAKASPIPKELDWDLYCGVSEKLPYVDGWYHRSNWRKWMAFGTGTQGDMGCHIMDPVFGALQLSNPKTVKSLGPKPFEKNFALISHIEYTFPGTEFTAEEVPLTWYNGELRPKKLAGLPDGIGLPGQGSVFIGEKGSMILPHIGNPVAYKPDGQPWDKESLPDPVAGISHFHEWIDAALDGVKNTGAPFSYAGPLTEAVLLGTVINRWPDAEFTWDADACEFSGDGQHVNDANALIAPAYKNNWSAPFVG